MSSVMCAPAVQGNERLTLRQTEIRETQEIAQHMIMAQEVAQEVAQEMAHVYSKGYTSSGTTTSQE